MGNTNTKFKPKQKFKPIRTDDFIVGIPEKFMERNISFTKETETDYLLQLYNRRQWATSDNTRKWNPEQQRNVFRSDGMLNYPWTEENALVEKYMNLNI